MKRNKRVKVDDQEEVSQLFQKSVKVSTIDMSVKKFVYKIIGEISNQIGKGKVPTKEIWQRYFKMSDDAQKNPQTGKAFLENREELLEALRQMESEDLVMVDGDDVYLTAS